MIKTKKSHEGFLSVVWFFIGVLPNSDRYNYLQLLVVLLWVLLLDLALEVGFLLWVLFAIFLTLLDGFAVNSIVWSDWA